MEIARVLSAKTVTTNSLVLIAHEKRVFKRQSADVTGVWVRDEAEEEARGG